MKACPAFDVTSTSTCSDHETVPNDVQTCSASPVSAIVIDENGGSGPENRDANTSRIRAAESCRARQVPSPFAGARAQAMATRRPLRSG